MTNKIETTDYVVCADCYQFALIGDATMFDGAYCEPMATMRHTAVLKGIETIVEEAEGPGHFSSVEDEESFFSHSRCECCGDCGGQRQTLQWVEVRDAV